MIKKVILEKISKEGYEQIILSANGAAVTEDYFYNEEIQRRGMKSSSEYKNDYIKVLATEYLEKGFLEVQEVGTLKNKNIVQTIFVLSKEDFKEKYPNINIDSFNWPYDIKVFEEDVILNSTLDLGKEDDLEATPRVYLKNLTIFGDIVSYDADTDCPIRVLGKTKAHSIIARGAMMYFNDVELTKSKKIDTNLESCLEIYGKLKTLSK